MQKSISGVFLLVKFIVNISERNEKMNSYNELPKTYSPSEFEDRIYAEWCEKGYFTPDKNNTNPSFSIVIPPPNVS